jgi:hypothetical protein
MNSTAAFTRAKLAPEVLARGQQEKSEQHHDRRARTRRCGRARGIGGGALQLLGGGVVAQRECDPGEAADHGGEHQCRRHGTGYTALAEPVHRRAQRVARQDSDQQWNEKGARKVERGDEREERKQRRGRAGVREWRVPASASGNARSISCVAC